MTDAERIKALEAALEYAINCADGWHDDSQGGHVEYDGKIDAARALLPGVKWEYQRRDEEYAAWKECRTYSDDDILTPGAITSHALRLLHEKIDLSKISYEIPSDNISTTIKIRKPSNY